MTFALTAALVATVTACFVLLDRKDRRHDYAVMNLCQRLQAPEAAVIQHQIEQADIPQPPVDDEEYWQQAEDHRQMIAQLEARENMPFDGAP